VPPGANLSVHGDDARLLGQLEPVFEVLARHVRAATGAPKAAELAHCCPVVPLGYELDESGGRRGPSRARIGRRRLRAGGCRCFCSPAEQFRRPRRGRHPWRAGRDVPIVKLVAQRSSRAGVGLWVARMTWPIGASGAIAGRRYHGATAPSDAVPGPFAMLEGERSRS